MSLAGRRDAMVARGTSDGCFASLNRRFKPASFVQIEEWQLNLRKEEEKGKERKQLSEKERKEKKRTEKKERKKERKKGGKKEGKKEGRTKCCVLAIHNKQVLLFFECE